MMKAVDNSFDGDEPADLNSIIAEFPHADDEASELNAAAKKLQDTFDDVARYSDSSLKVFLRVRPSSSVAESTIKVVSDTEMITTAPEVSNRAKYTKTEERQYVFNRIFGPDSDQSQVFDQVALPLLRRFEDGDSCVLFAYGITNAGKTHTIQGTGQDPGVLPRIVDELFASSSRSEKIELHLSMMEIYQEQIFDLLSKKREKLSIRDGNGKVEVPKLSNHKLNVASDAVKLMEQGASKRCQSRTLLNSESSRSHALYSITMNRKQNGRETISVFHIVDLAGAERVNRTKATGFQMKEANNINMSLMQLWRCLNAMKKKTNESVEIIPFRESKLTHLLMPLLSRASVGGVAMIACVNPQPDDYDETITVLSNASIASKIREITNVGRVATNNSSAPSSTLYQPTASSLCKEEGQKEKLGVGQKFLRKRKAVEIDSTANQSLISKMASHVGWSKKEKAATVNLTSMISANRNSSIEGTKAESCRPSTATIDSSIDDISDLLHQINELKRENAELLCLQASRETEIREEVAKEMALSTQDLLSQIEDLQSQLYYQSNDGNIHRSVKKARKRLIEISKQDKVKDLEAIEEEMEIVRAKYEHEIAELKDKLHLYEGMMKEYQLQAKQSAAHSNEKREQRSPLMVIKDTNTRPSPGQNVTQVAPLVGSKRKSNIELAVDIVNETHPFPPRKSPSPVNNENRGPPSIFPTVDKSPKFNSSAFRMLRSQVTGK